MSENDANAPEWTLGDRLRKALEDSGTGVGEMADLLEVKRNTVSNYIHDKVRVPGAVVQVWATRTNVPLEWLRTGDSSLSPNGGGDRGSMSTAKNIDRSRALLDALVRNAAAA